MPWRETEPMNERLQFIGDALAGLYTTSELCERYGVSRKTGYKWLSRFYEHGLSGLVDRSHAPHAASYDLDRAKRRTKARVHERCDVARVELDTSSSARQLATSDDDGRFVAVRPAQSLGFEPQRGLVGS